jgi:hypothetical protein
MKPASAAICVMFTALVAFAGDKDKKPLPNQAGNDDIDIFATVLLDHQEIQQAVGADLPDGFAAVRVRVVPKADQVLVIGPDDFTLISRKDGERSGALDPAQITGKAGMIVKAAANQPSRWSTVSNGPIWGGVKPANAPIAEADRAPEADRNKSDHPDRVSLETENTPEANPVLAALKAKELQDQESKKAVEGLLYFSVEGKLKPKDLGLVYKSPVGRMVVDFK